MSDTTQEGIRVLLEQLYDKAFKEGYKQAYGEMVPILRSAYEKVKEKQS